MLVYRTKTTKLAGTDYREVRRKAGRYYDEMVISTKRRPYARSAYFKKNKVFIELFWHHLFEKKNHWDQIRRMKFLPCAIELIRKAQIHPVSKENPDKKSEIFHRFAGITRDNDMFFVQIKENKNSGKKWLISVFPVDKRK